MKLSVLKDIADTMSRYADIRAPDADPRSKIGIQVDASGMMTMIAGDKECGILYRVGADCETESAPFSYAIDCRPFLQAVKLLSGKGDVALYADKEGLSVRSNSGGSVSIQPSCSLKSAGFIPKPKQFLISFNVEAKTWEQFSRIIPAIDPVSFEPPTIQASGGKARVVAVAKGNRPCYAMYEADEPRMEETVIQTKTSFWEGLKVLSEDGTIQAGLAGVIATSSQVECWAAPFPGGDAATAWPVLGVSGTPQAQATVQRTALIDAVRGVVPQEDKDEYGRITVQFSAGALVMSGFGDEGGITLPAKTIGSAVRSLRSDYIVKMLRASFGKQVTISVYGSPPISISSQDMPGWTILVAPVALG